MISLNEEEEALVSDHAKSDFEKQVIIQKCLRFTKWCDEVGIKFPKLEYPSFFDGGLVGVKVKE